jgi:hypothetical protein
MRVFTCGNCGQLVYFENDRCQRCGFELGFLPDQLTLATLRPIEGMDGAFAPLNGAAPVERCENAESAGCNWMVPTGSPGLCRACALSRRIPDLSVPENVTLWREAELAKRRLVYALLRLGLPLARREGVRLVFDILSDKAEAQPVLTGHADGLITINLAEADPAERERRRNDLGEAYRTLLGHFRHEVGHYYWDALVLDGGHLDACRAVFGDDSQDYAAAMKRHYAEGPPADWSDAFVSSYATMHPWEDFAETWAHYLHIVDALDTAEAFGIEVDPGVSRDPSLSAHVRGDAYHARSIDDLIAAWLPLCYAVNSLNRSLGQPDLYPFVLSQPAIRKLGYVHDLIRSSAGARAVSCRA